MASWSAAAREAKAITYRNGASPNAAEIGLACVLDYLDLRAIIDWRAIAPSLQAYMTDFAASVPGYHDSLPDGIPDAPGAIIRATLCPLFLIKRGFSCLSLAI